MSAPTTAWVFPGDVAAIAAKIGSSLEPDNAQWFNRFTVKSQTSSREYRVAQRRSDGTWGCDCPGWIHHRRCKHLTDILGRLAAVPSSQAPASVRPMLESARSECMVLNLHKEVF